MSWRIVVAWSALVAVALVLALRMTITESIDDPFDTGAGSALAAAPEPGPGCTVAFGLLALVACAGAWAANPRRDCILMTWAICAAGIIGRCAVSAGMAGNRFSALVGTFDVATGLIGGVAIFLAATTPARKRFVVALVFAILSAWLLKGFYQRFVEIPDTIQFYHEHKAEILAAHHWQENDPNVTLFEARMNSKELTGFITYSNNVGEACILFATLSAAAVLAFAFIRPGRPELGVPLLAFAAMFAVLTILTLFMVVLTQSKGGTIACGLCLVLVTAGFFLRHFLAVRRRGVWIAVVLCVVGGGAAVVGYGVRHDALPTRSLAFRWHYWTATAPMIRDHLFAGVGLNNFGEFYSQYKRPAAPEDVKDPHNTLLRLAAEAGAPTAVVWMALALAAIYFAFRAQVLPAEIPTAAAQTGRQQRLGGALDYSAQKNQGSLISGPTIAAIATFCLAWWIIRFPLTEALELYAMILTLMLAALAIITFSLAWAGLELAGTQVLRMLTLAMALGACGMLLYDQVNMALVTGPVAMFFWVALALAASDFAGPKDADFRLVWGLAPAFLIVLAIGLFFTVYLPVLDGTFPWDAAPYRAAADNAVKANDVPKALEAINEALARDPRNVGNFRFRIYLRHVLKEKDPADIRTILRLAPSDARVAISLLSMPETGLTDQERRKGLERALWLDEQLEATEPKRLSPETRAEITALIQTLAG